MVCFDTALAEEGGKYFVTARAGEKVRIFTLLPLTLDGGEVASRWGRSCDFLWDTYGDGGTREEKGFILAQWA